eukprot:gnl/Chilomastix_cuspidata/2685.p1 GENE.gnl/Chilomastix_cuspidata/2685~~gnl/Chilomastix_cuspidata/2685.p1  ORF type:complete len:397 (+),score=124.77 gnl/Chilomastix_cuspidata/2685:168-1193(+)
MVGLYSFLILLSCLILILLVIYFENAVMRRRSVSLMFLAILSLLITEFSLVVLPVARRLGGLVLGMSGPLFVVFIYLKEKRVADFVVRGPTFVCACPCLRLTKPTEFLDRSRAWWAPRALAFAGVFLALDVLLFHTDIGSPAFVALFSAALALLLLLSGLQLGLALRLRRLNAATALDSVCDSRWAIATGVTMVATELVVAAILGAFRFAATALMLTTPVFFFSHVALNMFVVFPSFRELLSRRARGAATPPALIHPVAHADEFAPEAISASSEPAPSASDSRESMHVSPSRMSFYSPRSDVSIRSIQLSVVPPTAAYRECTLAPSGGVSSTSSAPEVVVP